MRNHLCALGIAAVARWCAASIITLDIDPLPGMVNTPGSVVPLASQVSDQFLVQGVLVSSSANYAAVAKGEGVHWFPDPLLQNGLGGVNAAGALSYSSPVNFLMVDPCNPRLARTTTSFSLFTDYFGIGGMCSLTAFDIDGNVVDSDIKADHNGMAPFGTQYFVSGPGIVKVVFVGAGTEAVSNFQLEQPVAAGCVADLNGDGTVDGADLGILLAAWGTSGGCPNPDFNTDGVVDGADLGVLLAAWGACG